MNNISSHKNKHCKFKPWLFAISVCILGNLILISLFSTSKIEYNFNKQEKSKIIMLPLYNYNLSNSEKRLLYWMQDETPSLMTSPNSKYGYSRVLRSPISLTSFPKKTKFNKSILYQSIFTDNFKIAQIPLVNESSIDLFTRIVPFKTPSVPDTLPKRAEIYKYPYSYNTYTGVNFPIKFHNWNKIEQLIKKYNPKSLTQIELKYPASDKLLPYAKIISSCGSQELDKQALSNIIFDDSSKKIKRSLLGTTVNISIEWQNNYSKVDNK
ncbi:MAG TPA: hypothetical protein QF753_07775 [Victivallales bacterium]|nr:hypothetical protein [Victivallales bacterium]